MKAHAWKLCETPAWAGQSVHDGGYAEYLLVPQERYLVPLSSLSPTDAAPLTDAALTPYRAIKKALPFLELDYYALVIGLGGLGQYGLKLLQILSGCPVIDWTCPARSYSSPRWTGQNRPFVDTAKPAISSERDRGIEFYRRLSPDCKSVCTFVRQLRGPHFNTCA